jgi:hypothetical protein
VTSIVMEEKVITGYMILVLSLYISAKNVLKQQLFIIKGD